MSEERRFLFSNFGRSTLAAGIAADATQLQLGEGHGALFPQPAAGEIFALLLSTGSRHEIVYCTERASDVLTVERGKEGTTAQVFSAGTPAIHTVTAAFWEQHILEALFPPPVITSLVPDTVDLDSGGQDITIVGTGFIPSSTATFGGASRAVVYVSPTELTMTLLSGDVAATGTFSVVVTNPLPGGASNSSLFAVEYPVPAITSLDPDTVELDSGAQDITINGTGFYATTTGTFGGASRTVTYVGPTELTMSLLSGDVDDAGTFDVVVTNPSPGGGNSNTATFTVEDIAADVEYDPATHNSDITLSNGDLTASRGAANPSNWRSVLGNVGKSTGKWYWEYFITTGTTAGVNAIILGASQSGLSQTSYVGSDANSRGVQSRPTLNPLRYESGGSSSTSHANINYVTNDTVGMALDADAGQLDLYVNNTLIQRWTGIPAGAWYPAVSYFIDPHVVTLATTLVYDPPTGYSPLAP